MHKQNGTLRIDRCGQPFSKLVVGETAVQHNVRSGTIWYENSPFQVIHHTSLSNRYSQVAVFHPPPHPINGLIETVACGSTFHQQFDVPCGASYSKSGVSTENWILCQPHSQGLRFYGLASVPLAWANREEIRHVTHTEWFRKLRMDLNSVLAHR